MAKIMRVLEKIMHIIILNLLWIGGTIVGLVFFGVFPATYAVYKTFENEKLFEPHNPILPIVKQFIHEYKNSFLKMNGLMIIYFVLFAVLFLDFRILQLNQNLNVLLVPLVLLALYLLLTINYLFPIIDKANGKRSEKIKMIILAPWINIGASLKVLLYLMISVGVFYTLPPVFILLFPSMFIKYSSIACKNTLIKKEMVIIQ